MSFFKPLILSLISCFFISSSLLYSLDNLPKTPKLAQKTANYPFTKDPIDVVITTTPADLPTLNLCIEGIRDNCQNVRRVIVVSDKKLTDEADWFDPAYYPFSKEDVALAINKGDVEKAKIDLDDKFSNVEPYYHQLLRLYAGFVIEDLSPNYLVVDPDTIFLNPVTFINEENAGLYNSSLKACKDTIAHARRLVPNFKRAYYVFSGQAKHLLFQKCVLNDLFLQVENGNKTLFWKAYCDKIDPSILNGEGASEYELYFNFVFSKSKQVKIRKLKYLDVIDVSAAEPLKAYGYDYMSCRAWKRDWLVAELKKHEMSLKEANDASKDAEVLHLHYPK